MRFDNSPWAMVHLNERRLIEQGKGLMNPRATSRRARWPLAAILLGFLVAHVALGQDPSAKLDARSFLRQTAASLRPAATSDLLSLALELNGRGQGAAAQAVLSSIKTTSDDFDRLVRSALALIQPSAADLLLQQWQRSFADDPRIRLLRAARYHSTGENELAQRELGSLNSNSGKSLGPILPVLRAILESPPVRNPSPDSNPWGIRFVGPDGRYQPGSISADEKKKVTPELVQGLADLLALNPLDGSLWAWMGEFLNADGEVGPALECFERARSLQFTPKWLNEHRRALEDHQRAQTREATAQASRALPTAAIEPPTDVGPSLRSRPGVVIVLASGLSLILVIAVLQWREWRKPKV